MNNTSPMLIVLLTPFVVHFHVMSRGTTHFPLYSQLKTWYNDNCGRICEGYSHDLQLLMMA